jgi:hypothetical protein
MTAGSCSVAIRRRRPPQWAHASTSMPNPRCMRAAQLQARGLLFAFVPSGPAASGATVGSGSATRRPPKLTKRIGIRGLTHRKEETLQLFDRQRHRQA